MVDVADVRVEDVIRGVRDRLLVELERLDALGEFAAAISLDSAILTLSERLGDPPDPVAIAALERRFFNN